MPEKRTPLHRRIRPSVPVTLDVDGEQMTFNLSFDMNALARIEEKTGLKLVGNIFTLWAEMSSARVLAACFWATAVNHHPEYDTKEGYHILVSLVEKDNLELIGKALAEAYPLFLSKDKADLFRKILKGEQEENPSQPEPKPAENSAGSPSGPSQSSISVSASASSAS